MDPALILEDDAPASSELSLQYDYSFWYINVKEQDGWNPENFGSFRTVQQFWKVFQYLKRPSELSVGSQIFLFRKGIRPEWEDEAFLNGGRFLFKHYRRNHLDMANKLWEELVLAFIGEQFTYRNEVLGIMVHLKNGIDGFQVWIKNGRDEKLKQAIHDDLVRIWEAPRHVSITFDQFHKTEEEKSKNFDAAKKH